MATATLTSTPLRQHPRLKLLASGKVREVYALDDEKLLFVTTDRISAFDRVMKDGIPRKGELLTRLSCWWFDFFSREMPELRTHFLAMGLPDSLKNGMPGDDAKALDRRTMATKKLKVRLLLENILSLSAIYERLFGPTESCHFNGLARFATGYSSNNTLETLGESSF